MKTSLRKLRFVLQRQDAKERRDFQPLAQLDELAQASQDMEEMRDCYDSFLSAAAAIANNAYETSESLREMGDCLLEKTALIDDEESGKVLLMLGKLQFELQKLFDSYRSHLFQTITVPSESLLNELRTVEEMKRQCDEKRNVYEYMITRQREKGWSRSGKGETFSSEQLQAAHDEYDEEASLFVFRLKSLKQGQPRSLLTQAARHHAAQLSFFRRGLKYLEAVEPHVRLLTEQLHIDYKFSGLEDDDGDDADDDDDYDDESYVHDDGELSFDYGQNDQEHDVDSTSRNSMELDQVDITFASVPTVETPKENVHKSTGISLARDYRAGSQSEPLFPEKKFDPSERIGQLRPSSTRKFHTYVLPTPNDTKTSISSRSGNFAPNSKDTTPSGFSPNLWHSSPLEQPKTSGKGSRDGRFSGPLVLNPQTVLKESNTSISQLPPPLAEGLSLPSLESRAASHIKRNKRQAFSGPLTSKPWSTRPDISASGPLLEHPQPQMYSGPILRNPARSSPSKASPTNSPSFVSSPKINELHELPRPPESKYSRHGGLVGHSAPLTSRGPEQSNRPVVTTRAASPLPTPPQTLPRSYSIPSRGPRETVLHGFKPLDARRSSDMVRDVASPPLTPISLPNMQPASTSGTTVRDDHSRGAG